MNRMRAMLVIARRDYVATVWSRTFLLFLVGPLFPILFGALFGSIGVKMRTPPPPAPVIAIVADPVDAEAIVAARGRLAPVLRLPELRFVSPADPGLPALFHDPGVAAVLTGVPDRPTLHGDAPAVNAFAPRIGFLLSEARLADRSIVSVAKAPFARAAAPPPENRTALARGAQMLVVVLTMILSGLLLSNLIEEKSNKIIEVLAAAVPMESIFGGKLLAMLGMSLTGIVVWAGTALATVALLAPQLLASLPTPAVGWPVFVALGFAYFAASYLLTGALLLGVGAQAGSVREVQTLSMPMTMGQLIFFWLASAAIDVEQGPLATLAILLPWSSPYTMIARAATHGALLPHLLALAWHVLLVAFMVRFGARLFRLSVLKSGGGLFGRRRL